MKSVTKRQPRKKEESLIKAIAKKEEKKSLLYNQESNLEEEKIHKKPSNFVTIQNSLFFNIYIYMNSKYINK